MNKNNKPKTEESLDNNFPLTIKNYKLIVIGFAIIILGFLLMLGGGSANEHEFSKDVYSFRRITLAPIVVLIGFIFEIYAIMAKTKEK
ncbi:DUF3098 domain-containing protein [Marinilabiliaceae bacterium JC040]|nr:DUF3098 domain-containing protein [Marinilabiliaceae bacterium JC040]